MLRNYSHAAYESTETIVISGAMGAGQVVILVTYTTTAIAVQENDVVVTLASANSSYAQCILCSLLSIIYAFSILVCSSQLI